MPAPYTPPFDDIRFIMTHLIGVDKLSGLPGYEAFAEDVLDAVLSEAGKLAVEKFAPLNEVGDKKGLIFEKGNVSMPSGFKDAYDAFVAGGWNGLPVEAEFGGQGLPWLLAMSVQEIFQAANIGLALCPLLNQGAIELLSVHGSAELKEKFLPKLVSGEWTGTMNLTEPQAGSDVGAVKCKAEVKGEAYRITGQKIFISYGDHDLARNILHLVLARLPNAPEGTRGLSLFLVPKFLVNNDGSLGQANDVRVVSLEHKLGQHSSPTCVMAYGDKEGAVGYLVGKENQGIAAMFTMMNNARISVGIQGLGLMERSYQHALEFAKTRIQSRPIENSKAQPVAIIHHPDVCRMLLNMRAYTEAARSLAYSCGFAVDVAKRASDEAQKTQATARVDLLTPIVKSWLTDIANEVTSTGVQVFGGMGYIEETGAAQFMRDARILAIYEGTNGIQANDLVFRKLLRDQGAAFQNLTQEIDVFLTSLKTSTNDNYEILHQHLTTALQAMKETAMWEIEKASLKPTIAAASASPFLRLCGNVLGGYYLAQLACLAQSELDKNTGDATYLKAKINTALFYATHVLPECASLAVVVKEGATSTLGGLLYFSHS